MVKVSFRLNLPRLALFFSSFAVSSLSYATIAGPYIGGQVGWGYIHQGDYIASHLQNSIDRHFPGAYSTIDRLNLLFRDTGLAERIFIGFQFNSYFAAELGYYHFTPINVNADLNLDLTVLKRFDIDVPVDLSGNVQVATYAIDLVAKGILPITDRFSAYAKLGLAYLNSDGRISASLGTPIGRIGFYANPTVNIVYPTATIGLNYDLTQHISADFSWTRIQKINPCPYPNIDFVGVGVIYHFSS